MINNNNLTFHQLLDQNIVKLKYPREILEILYHYIIALMNEH